MDILEIEDVLKGLPDQALRQEAQQPSGQVPQYMVVSEIQRRSKMRKRFEAQKEQPSTTVAEQILTGGVASVAPPPPQMMGAMGMPQQPPAPLQQPPMGQQQPPMQPQQMPPQQPPMPQQGAPMPPPVKMAGGGGTSGSGLPYAGQPAGQEENIRNLLLQFSEEDLIQQMPFLEDAIREVARINRSGVEAYDVPLVGSVPSVTSTVDTGAENLIFNQPVVAEGFEKRTPQQEAISKFVAPDPDFEQSGNIRRRARETAQGVTFEELFPGRPSTGGQMGRVRPTGQPVPAEDMAQINELLAIAETPYRSLPEEPYGMLRSDAVGFEPLRSQQNILQETISDMALVGNQPIVTDVASSSAIKNDAQTGAVAPKSTSTEITEKEVAVGLSDVTPEDKVNLDISKSIKYVSPDIPELVAPSFASLITEQERRLDKIKEDAKRDVSAQALINLGAGVMEGDVAGGLRAAGEAASKVRTAERAAESDIANLQTRIKMAEEQGKFDTAKALRADALKEAQFEATFGLKRGELAQTLRIAQDRIEAEGNTEKGRALRARLTALNDLASRLQAQVATTGIKDPATDAALQQALSQLQSLLGVKVADSDSSDPWGIRKTG